MDSRIQRVAAIIEDNPDQKLTVVIMARSVHLSPSYLRQKFKAETGVTPTVYLQNVRMKNALSLLKSQTLSIKEVRAAIGLDSDSYFTRLCLRRYGLCPSQLKNR